MVLNLENCLPSLLHCAACNETYRQPRILHCLHSYCFDCIEKLKRLSGEETYIKCLRCEQSTKLGDDTVLPNYFFVNCLAASKLKELREHGVSCGNCKKDDLPTTVFCQECNEHLCSDCVYCHQNTKVTRNHFLVPKDDYERRLSVFGHEPVFCRVHCERKVEQYCASCHETICPGCHSHAGHNLLSLAEAYSMETAVLKELLLQATAKVESHEKSAMRYCSITDELRERKGEVSDKIRSYFAERREILEKDEEKLLEMVLLWYDRNFEMIKTAQKEEELKIEKVTNALNLSQIVLKHGTDVEILSMKNLIQSQLNEIAEYNEGGKLLASLELAIRNASWDILPEHPNQVNCLQGLKLPEVNEPQEQKDTDEVISSEHDDWEVIDKKSVLMSKEKEWNNEEYSGRALFQFKNVDKAVRSFGLEGRDYHVGSARKKKIWKRLRKVLGGEEEGMEEKEEFERDYRYDTILRTKIIGQQGSDCGEFQHPCDIAVDYERDDRLIVTDYNNNRVQIFNYLGDYLFEFGSRGEKPGQFMGPTGVAVLGDGSTIVCDCLNNRVQIFTQQGHYSRTFGKEGRGQGEFWRPMGVAVDSENRIIVVDQGNNRVQVFDKNGDFCFSFGKLGNWDGEVSCPNFVAVDKHDNIYVSDEVNMRIQIFNRDGTYLRKVTFQEIHGFRGNMKLLSGIAVDSRGHIVVGGKSSCTVGIFTPDGRFLRTFSSKRTYQSRVQFATGIALTSGGEIAICDWFNNKIRFF